MRGQQTRTCKIRTKCVEALSQPDITFADHFRVYALVSPLWGNCYVGACGTMPTNEANRAHQANCLMESLNVTTSMCPSVPSSLKGLVSVENVIMLVLAAPGRRLLPQAERYFIRKLQPVFNERKVQNAPYNVLRTIAPTVAEDVYCIEKPKEWNRCRIDVTKT